MLVVLKENLFKVDVDRLLDIVKKYGIEFISGNCFELPETISAKDLDILQQDNAVDKIVVNDYKVVENMLMIHGMINE